MRNLIRFVAGGVAFLVLGGYDARQEALDLTAFVVVGAVVVVILAATYWPKRSVEPRTMARKVRREMRRDRAVALKG